MELKTKLNLDTIRDEVNLCGKIKDEDLEVIGNTVVQDYEADKQSRRQWEKRMQDATDLALQITQDKTYPWPNAANVKFPLLTIASLQFQARAYPALVKAPDLVKFRVQGNDEQGRKAARAGRVSRHMSYQLLEQDEGWEEDQDKALLALPILGCVFKKSYWDATKEHNCSKLVLPKNLVVHYYAKSIEDCERKTEVIQLYEREVRERVLRKVFTDHEYGPVEQTQYKDEDERQGLSPPMNDSDRPRIFLEQHRYLDLDGDGYKEPYVVTVDKSSHKVARIVARIKTVTTEQSVKIEELQGRIRALAEGLPAPDPQNQPTQEDLMRLRRAEAAIQEMQQEIQALSEQKPKILRIEPVEYYTKYSFMPSPDGGFYDLGFGALLSPLNDSVNTLINQLIDSGSLQNGSVGFIGRGARIKGGKVRFSPNEWKQVPVAGATLRDSLVPLPVNPPSDVLFNLLSLLINYAERVSSVTDAMVGENPGQNTPAYNMSAMLEQGLQVFNGIFKRVYRSFRSELRKLYHLNSIYLDEREYFTFQDEADSVLRVDYTADPKDLIPAADPNAFSSKEKLMKAQAVREAAMTAPGYDPIKVEKRFLEALDIPDTDEVFPLVPEMNPETGEPTGAMTYKFPPQPDPEFEIKRAEEQRRTLEAQDRAEVSRTEAAAKMMVSEADVILKLAQAKNLGDETALKQMELVLEELQDRRKALVEAAKIENQPRADSGVDGKSGNA